MNLSTRSSLLMMRLKQQGMGDKTRPIIFIGHSFGGIVIEEVQYCLDKV
jgi:surfactin synthase thioesterase subunit